MPLPQLGSEPGQGLADHARHVIRHTLDPSFLELYSSPDDVAGGVINPPGPKPGTPEAAVDVALVVGRCRLNTSG